MESGQHLLALINGAGKMVLKPAQFSISDSVHSTCGAVRPLAGKKHIEIVQDVADAPPCVWLDEIRFRQVLWNLLSNAIKFTDPRGRIDVSVRRSGDDRFLVSVRDSGIGIAPEDMSRLFKTFEQLDDSFNRRYEGTGLGLALTRSLVELQGGVIFAESRKGVGSVFTVDLPVKFKPDP